MGYLLVIMSFVLAAAACPISSAAAEPLPEGKARFDFTAWEGPRLDVWTFKPRKAQAPLPVVFVMHGLQRNGSDYRDDWVGLAAEHGFLLVVPEFSEAAFPKAWGYNLGNVITSEGRAVPRARWAFTAIERIFDHLLQHETGIETRYRLYGHSAGAQFAHRFLYFVPDARVVRVVTANAGWYTMPDAAIAYPYGLAGSGVDEAALTKALARPLTVLLGEADIDPQHRVLRRTPEAMQQGPHRLSRGKAFFEAARSAAAQRRVPFAWTLETVPGVAHDNARMAPAAVRNLLQK